MQASFSNSISYIRHETAAPFRQLADVARRKARRFKGCGRSSCEFCASLYPRSLCSICGAFVPKPLPIHSARILKKSSRVRDQSASPLLRLPPEIRSMIWTELVGCYVVNPRVNGHCYRGNSFGTWETGRESYRVADANGLFATCRQILQEATVTFYEKNTFYFCGSAHLIHFSHCLEPSYMSMIRNIYMDKSGYPVDSLLDGTPSAIDLLSSLGSRGLTELTYVLPDYHGGGINVLDERLCLSPLPLHWGLSVDLICLSTLEGVARMKVLVPLPFDRISNGEMFETFPSQKVIKEKVALLRRSEKLRTWEDDFIRRTAEKRSKQEVRDVAGLFDWWVKSQ